MQREQSVGDHPRVVVVKWLVVAEDRIREDLARADTAHWEMVLRHGVFV